MPDFRTSVLICQRFPFTQETGEIYLREEIGILAAHSVKVIVLSCFSSDRELSFRLPDNVLARSIAAGPDGRTQKIEAAKAAVRVAIPGCGHNTESRAEGFWQRTYIEAMYGLADRICSNAEAVLNVLCRDSIDIDLVYSYRLTLTARVAMHVASWAEAHGHERPLVVSRAQPFRSEILAGIDCIFPCSEEGANYLKSKHPNYAEKIEASYLGSRGATTLRDFHVSDSITMISCSTLDPVKRVNLIVDAVEKIVKAGISIKWIHIGAGKSLSELKKRCGDRLPDGSYKLMGSMGNDKIFALYEEIGADIFVNVSSSEGIPQAIMEALSFGIPVVATNVGGNSEIVLNGINGWLIDADDAVSGLVSAIVEYSALPVERKVALRCSARSVWEERFSAKANAERFVCRLRECLGDVR